MPCTIVPLPGGRAIVCIRTRRPTCACGVQATLQCDAPTKRSSGTCDRHLCASCAVEVGPNRRLCAVHAERGAMLISSACDVGREKQQAAQEPVQAGLF